MSAKRVERHIDYIDESGEVSHFTCHKCGKGYYGDDSNARRFHFCPMCGASIDHTAFVPKNVEKQRRKMLRNNVKPFPQRSRCYWVRVERTDGREHFDHYNKKPHGRYWNWYECGYIVGGLSLRTVSESGCAAVLAAFRKQCDRFAEGYRGYSEAELAMPEGQYRLTLMRDGVPSISCVVNSVKPPR